MNNLFLSAFLALAAAPVGAESFTLPELPYPAGALAPTISEEIMQIHHGRHHQGYVDNLNKAVKDDSRLQGQPVEAILANVSAHSTTVRNNAGGHYNHDLFWKVMAPAGTGGEASDALRERIEQDFGSLDAMKKAFNEAAGGVFGSGWAWLIVEADGGLAITTTANQDNPLMDVADTRGVPILGLDVWEHAYYLQYENKRGDYVARWWDVVNWDEVSRRFEAAR